MKSKIHIQYMGLAWCGVIKYIHTQQVVSYTSLDVCKDCQRRLISNKQPINPYNRLNYIL